MRTFAKMVFLLLLAMGCVNAQSQDKPSKAARPLFPATFSSTEEADRWISQLMTGGRMDRVSPGSGSYLVIFRHGSGRPVIRVGLYVQQQDKWELVSEINPPLPGEFLRASVDRGKIILVGERSGRVWPFFNPAEPPASAQKP